MGWEMLPTVPYINTPVSRRLHSPGGATFDAAITTVAICYVLLFHYFSSTLQIYGYFSNLKEKFTAELYLGNLDSLQTTEHRTIVSSVASGDGHNGQFVTDMFASRRHSGSKVVF